MKQFLFLLFKSEYFDVEELYIFFTKHDEH